MCVIGCSEANWLLSHMAAIFLLSQLAPKHANTAWQILTWSNIWMTCIAKKWTLNANRCWKLFNNSYSCNQQPKLLAKFVFRMSAFHCHNTARDKLAWYSNKNVYVLLIVTATVVKNYLHIGVFWPFKWLNFQRQKICSLIYVGVRVSNRVRVRFRINIRTSKVSIKCRCVVNAIITYTAVVCVSMTYNYWCVNEGVGNLRNCGLRKVICGIEIAEECWLAKWAGNPDPDPTLNLPQ